MAVADDIAAALKAATRELAADKKRRERDAARAARLEDRRDRLMMADSRLDRVTLRDAVFRVLPEAIAKTSGDGAYPFPARNLFYAVRPLIQAHTTEELKYAYFSQTLLVDYQRDHGPIRGMYRDPRGELHEPHTGEVVRLGTREVAAYQLPEWTFDKILYVEKEGLEPILAAAQLTDRYDLAVAYGKGQPVEAVRDLFARAEAGEYRLFALHDADVAGYTIARAMREATARMPGYSVDVVDLGLTVADAIQRGLQTEAVTRRKALPWWMPGRLTDQEREWFEGRLLTQPWQKSQWACTRVELNALTAPDLIAYIEAGLERHGAIAKIVPPAQVLQEQAAERHRAALAELVDAYLAERFAVDELVERLVAEFPLDAAADLGRVVADAHQADRATWWKAAIHDHADRQVDDAGDQARARLAELLAERLRDQDGG